MSDNKQINEGFWDSVVSTAKRMGLAAAATAGSKSASGKLSAENLSNELYKAYKHWLGATGSEGTPEDMAHFLANDIGFGGAFAKDEAQEFARFQNDPSNYDAADAPKGAAPGGEGDHSGSLDNHDEQSNDQSGPASSSQDFTSNPAFTDFVKQVGARGYKDIVTHNPTGYKFSTKPDGSIVFASQGKEKLLKDILAQNSDPKAMAAELHKNGLFTTWANFKSTNGGSGMRGIKSAAFAKNALMAGADKFGKNYIKQLNRYVVAKPSKDEPFKLVESVLEEDFSDSELRKYFLGLAQRALKSGAAKSAARTNIKKPKVNPDAQHPGHGAYQQPQSPAPQAQDQAQPAAQSAPAQSSEAPAAQPTEVKLADVNLTPDEQKLVNQVTAQAGVDGLAKMVDSKDPEITAIARKVLAQALGQYETTVKSSKRTNESVQLDELMNSSVPYKTVSDKPKVFTTMADIGGRQLVFMALYDGPFDLHGNSVSAWSVDFSDHTDDKVSFSLTGQGNEYSVFSFVMASFREFIEKKDPGIIRFKAAKSDRSRADLYEKMLKRYLPPDYEFKRTDSGTSSVNFWIQKKV